MISTTAAVHSDTGNLRKFNEDSYYVSPDENLVIVCDGMGGQVAGGLASKMAVETIQDVFSNFEQQHLDSLFPDLNDELNPAARRMISAIRLANRRIYKMATRFPKLRGMGTTVTVLTFDESLAIMMHVGDSRIFRLSEGKIVQLTEDHSWLNELIEDKEIEGEEIERFSKKNIITRALGTSSCVKIDIHCEKYTKDDLYILSTDGLHNSLNSKEIKSIVSKQAPLANLAEKLIKKAKRKDGSDNITVALVKIDEDGTRDTVSGISTTIPEEDYTILSREDKFIRQRYNDSTIPDKKRTLSANQSRALLGGALAISLILAVSLFIKSQSRSNAEAAAIAKAANTKTVRQEKFTHGIGNNQKNNPGMRAVSLSLSQNPQNLEAKKDAVLALVFFGSFEDYQKALTEDNRIILDKMQPYLNEDSNSPEGELTMFIVDESNDVLHKTIITLPKPVEKAP